DEAANYSFNVLGKSQNDSRFGDIRIGTHRMDGALGVLAHTYLPTSIFTAGGDSHFDSAEQWVTGTASGLSTGGGGGKGGGGNLTFGSDDPANLTLLIRPVSVEAVVVITPPPVPVTVAPVVVFIPATPAPAPPVRPSPPIFVSTGASEI